jgi:hypothetical protein
MFGSLQIGVCLEFKAITKCSKYQVVIKFNLLVVI